MIQGLARALVVSTTHISINLFLLEVAVRGLRSQQSIKSSGLNVVCKFAKKWYHKVHAANLDVNVTLLVVEEFSCLDTTQVVLASGQ